MEWIAVAERMPDEGRKCLVFAPRDRVARQPELNTVMTWTKFQGWWPGLGDRITHWMPWPEPPC